MFAGTTFINTFDRLSAPPLPSHSISLIYGCLLTVAWIIISFILFIAPLVSYFQYQYIQNSYLIPRHSPMKQCTGNDIKLAISFYNKQTHQLINHTQLLALVNVRVNYISESNIASFADVLPCNSSYFGQIQTREDEDFGSQSCFIVPNNLMYNSVRDGNNNFLSKFGFSITPKCSNPFTCTLASTANSQADAQRLNFFRDHYYIFYFTSNTIDTHGNLVKKFNRVYSTQWQSRQTLIPYLHILLHTTRLYLDNSIMPWINNSTRLFSSWLGLTDAPNSLQVTNEQLNSYGFNIMITSDQMESIVYREIKKLDWLLMVVGGGVFLLYLIGLGLYRCISNAVNRYYVCETMVLVRQKNQKGLAACKIPRLVNPLFHLMKIFQAFLCCKCFQNYKKIVKQSYKTIDIVQSLKKHLITRKNIQSMDKNQDRNGNITKILDKNTKQQRQQNTQMNNQDRKQEQILQISNQSIKMIRKQTIIPQICNNNLTMMNLYHSGNQQKQNIKIMSEFQIQNDQQDNRRSHNINIGQSIQQIYRKQQYSKYTCPDLYQSQNQNCCSKICKNILDYFGQFIKFFDVFGARPALNTSQSNSSLFGCLITCIITILSILVFSLTLHNMSTPRPYTDKIYQYSQQNTTFTTGSTTNLALCFPQQAFDLNLLQGVDRVVNISFYQYFRSGNQSTQIMYETEQIGAKDALSYFDRSNQILSKINMTYCFRPQNKKRVYFYGSMNTSKQAYFGFKIVPYCSPYSACQSAPNTTITNFYNLLNQYALSIYLPSSKYLPYYGTVMTDPTFYQITNVYPSILTLNFSTSMLVQFPMSVLHLYDDRQAWLMGSQPEPTASYLSCQSMRILPNIQSVSLKFASQMPYLNIKLLNTGQIQRTTLTVYKIYYLFGVIGSSFIFFWFFFNRFGLWYNQYQVYNNLAILLFNQNISKYKYTLNKILGNWLCCRYCEDQVLQKICQITDTFRLAKNIDILYRLSVLRYISAQKDLALIYVKQKLYQVTEVKNVEILEIEEEQKQSSVSEDLQANQNRGSKMLNQSQSTLLQQQKQFERQIPDQSQKSSQQNELNLQPQPQLQHQPLHNPHHPSSPITCLTKTRSFLSKFDFFVQPQQLTISNQLQMTSICGGLCSILLIIFLCVLISYPLVMYFDNRYIVSREQIISQNGSVIELSTGVNFSLAVSFAKLDLYQVIDITNITHNTNTKININLVKYKITRVNQQQIQTQIDTIALVPCTSQFLDKFVNIDKNSQFYIKFSFAYCVPDGVRLTLSGSAEDSIKEYFSIVVSSVHSDSASLAATQLLLSSHIPRYHVSSPIISHTPSFQYSPSYTLKTITPSRFYQTSAFRSNNLTLTLSKVQYHTSINPSNQYPSTTAYSLTNMPESLQYHDQYPNPSFPVPPDFSNTSSTVQFKLVSEVYQQKVKIYKILVSQIMGIVGGCIVMLFWGLGWLARSFNQYKLRVVIGSKLYQVGDKDNEKQKKKTNKNKAKKKKSKSRNQVNNSFETNVQNKPQQQDQQPQDIHKISQIQIFKAWLSSFINFISNTYTNSTYKKLSILQSRVTQQLNLYYFIKNHYQCQNSINKILKNKLNNYEALRLSRIYLKPIIEIGQDDQQKCNEIVNQLDGNQKKLKIIAFENQLTYWQINTLIQAKRNNVNTTLIFPNNKNLQKYFRNRSNDNNTNSQNSSIQQSMFNSSTKIQDVSSVHQRNSEQSYNYDKSQHESNKNKSGTKDKILENDQFLFFPMKNDDKNNKIIEEQIQQNQQQQVKKAKNNNRESKLRKDQHKEENVQVQQQ